MQTRSVSEIQSLDDELNLFEENDWDFMSIVDTKGANYEYFNDIRDSDFVTRRNSPTKYLSIAACVLFLCMVFGYAGIHISNVLNDKEYNDLARLQNIGGLQATGVNMEEGIEATPEDLVDISNLLGSYTSCIQAKSDYTSLDKYCISKSQFAKKYYDTTKSVVTIYDVSDCYARGLREFAGYYHVRRINKVVQKDGIYYCYATVTYPTIYDVSEYVQMRNQSFVMKFQGGYNISEATVAKFLLEVLDDTPVTSSDNDVCIKFKRSGDDFKLIDDAFILEMASDDYTVAVNQLLKSLGSLLTA